MPVLGSQALLLNPYLDTVRAEWDRLADAGQMPSWGASADDWVGWLDDIGPWAAELDADLAAARFAQRGLRPRKELLEAFASVAGDRITSDRLELAARDGEVTEALDQMAGHSPSMVALRQAAWSAAFGRNLTHVPASERLLMQTPVLIAGPTGVGKELVARAIAAARPWVLETKGGGRRRARSRYEPVHLGSIPRELVPSALFGYERGAFTGAQQPMKGVLTRCHGGAVFLDEIGELPEHTQVALLRCLQEGQVRPLGGDDPIPAAPRVISATHRDLRHRVEEGAFREDLLQRIGAVTITVPSLLERTDDIPELVDRLLAGFDLGDAFRGDVRDEVIRWTRGLPNSHPWIGNVRELESAIQAIALGLEPRLNAPTASGSRDPLPADVTRAAWPMARLRAWYARRALAVHKTKTEAAYALGVARTTFDRYLEADDAS
ncbi:MAG: sigma-54-dependent Fis family transcriptional regulator [Proteobacteria bacterium]|nr:sigma-54-dependent Fis family transcriptional regulator [Pseudomonadota bacterium]